MFQSRRFRMREQEHETAKQANRDAALSNITPAEIILRTRLNREASTVARGWVPSGISLRKATTKTESRS